MEELMKPDGFEESNENGNRNEWQSSTDRDEQARPAASYDERQPMYASDEDDKDDDDDDDDEESLEGGLSEWGDVDPQSNNSPFPDPNEPTAPGSAV